MSAWHKSTSAFIELLLCTTPGPATPSLAWQINQQGDHAAAASQQREAAQVQKWWGGGVGERPGLAAEEVGGAGATSAVGWERGKKGGTRLKGV